MLTAIEGDLLHWDCLLYDEDGALISCGQARTAYIDEAVYRSSEERGAVIALPQCTCGAQCFLKADYTLKELSRVVQAIKNEQGVIWAYVLPLRYVRNLRAQWMLYERGKAMYAPVLPMPEQEVLILPHFIGVPPDVVYGLWFGFATVQARLVQLGQPKME